MPSSRNLMRAPVNLTAPDDALRPSFSVVVVFCYDARRLGDSRRLHGLLYGGVGFDPILPLPVYFRAPFLDCPEAIFLYSLSLLSDPPDILFHFPYFVVKKHDYLHQSEYCE